LSAADARLDPLAIRTADRGPRVTSGMVAERRRQKEVESDPALPTGDRGHVHAFNTDRRRHAAASSRATVEICTVSGDPAGKACSIGRSMQQLRSLFVRSGRMLAKRRCCFCLTNQSSARDTTAQDDHYQTPFAPWPYSSRGSAFCGGRLQECDPERSSLVGYGTDSGTFP
jgi:hypothetical protein